MLLLLAKWAFCPFLSILKMIEPVESKGYFVMLLTLFHLICLINFSSVEARTRHHKWEVKYEYKSPDCYKKLIITINGRSPGPTIFAQQGDTVVVQLKNSLWTENVAVHWHGIRQVSWGFRLHIFNYPTYAKTFCCAYSFLTTARNALEWWNRRGYPVSDFTWRNLYLQICCRQGKSSSSNPMLFL